MLFDSIHWGELMDITNLIWKIQDLFVLFFMIFIGIYIYIVLAVRDSAKKLGIPKKWANISWMGTTIPYVMANSAKKHWWPTIVLPLAISFLGIFGVFYNLANIFSVVLMIILMGYLVYLKWEICEQRDIYGWWALVSPGLIILAIVLITISNNLEIISIILTIISLLWYLALWGILAWTK
jgi:hypothetical protein